jgi:hypothetical protein
VAKTVNLALKGALLGLLALAVLAPDLPQWEGKGMGTRAAFYWLAAVLVPAIWWARGRRDPYPHVVDALVVAPFLVDVGGNALDLYDRIDGFDDFAHLVNWAFLVSAFGAVMVSLPIGRLNAASLALGFGAVTHILWELAEWVAQEVGTSGLNLTYDDTIGDLALSLTGSIVGSILTATLLWRHRGLARSLV